MNYSTEKQNLINADQKITKNQLTKSLTSFHTKKNTSKDISSQNPPKKPGLSKQDKTVKSKRVYLSSKKAKAFNYLKLNQISPENNILYDLNKQENEANPKNKIYNAPSSVRRSFKYKNCYILNNLNNYQPNVIPGAIIKTTNNKYAEIKLSESMGNNIDNNTNSLNKSENRRTNGVSNNTNENINETNENNSLIQTSSKGLNTITFNINNNFNNCYNNFNSNNNNAKSFSNFNGYMNAMGSKSVSNLNEFVTFNSREKLSNKLEDSESENIYNMNIDIGNDNKFINNKRSNLFKDKPKNKIKSKQNIYSNTNSISTFNNSKKNQKPIILNDKNKINENKKYIYETVDNAKQNGDNNFIRTKDIYNFNNQKINSNNQRNFDNKNNEINNTKSMNSSVGDQKNQNEMNKDNNNNTNNKQKDKNSEINSQYQTYSGSFRNTNKIIRVNMIDGKKNNNLISENYLYNDTQNVNQQKLGFKNNNKSSGNLKISIDKNDNKNVYGCKIYNKKNNSESNKKININNNNKVKNNDKNKNNKNILIQTYNNLKKGKNEEDNINEKGDIIQTSHNESNYKNDLQTKSVSSLDYYTKKGNIPLTRENSITYVRKRSLNMKIYNNENENNNLMSNRPPTFKHKKNYSISTSGCNSQRYLNEVKIDLKNNKKNYVYSPKNDINNINEKTIVIPEYQIKLENIKSRINNLLNVYSLLALRSLNITNGDNNNENLNKKEEQ